MIATVTKCKAAVIREEGYPIGQPAPCYIKCSCGAKPRSEVGQNVRCECGTLYDSRGWVLNAVEV